MKFSIKTDQLDKQLSDVLVIGVYESLKVVCEKLSLSPIAIGHIASALKQGDMSGKVGSSLILYNVSGIKIPKILLIGLGKEKEFDGKKYHAAVRSMVYALKKMETWMLTVILFVTGTILTIIGFFLRSAYSTINKQIEILTLENQKRIEDQGKLKGKFELLEQENRLKLQHIEENTQHEIRVMATKIGDLSDTVGELVRIQMNGTTRRRNTNN